MGREDNSYIFNILSSVSYLEMVFLEVRRGGFSMLKSEVHGFKCSESIKPHRVKLLIDHLLLCLKLSSSITLSRNPSSFSRPTKPYTFWALPASLMSTHRSLILIPFQSHSPFCCLLNMPILLFPIEFAVAILSPGNNFPTDFLLAVFSPSFKAQLKFHLRC